MRREVEPLLSSFDSAESFLETPAVAKVAEAIEIEKWELKNGQSFGHYRIIKLIGAGEVYKVLLADMVTAFTKPLDDLAIANAQNGGGRQQLSAEKSFIENESTRANNNSFARVERRQT